LQKRSKSGSRLYENYKRKVRTPKGSEPDNVRAFEKSGDDKCNREQTSLSFGVMGETVRQERTSAFGNKRGWVNSSWCKTK